MVKITPLNVYCISLFTHKITQR